jgi:hypothetical protein
MFNHTVMSRLSGLLIAAVLLAGLLPACKSGSEKNNGSVSPELITNPITASGKKTNNNLPVISFETTKHDFGTMVQGEKLAYTFKFTNTGGSDLIISDASSTCGCTIPDWSKAPVKPGETGKMQVMFNSAGKSGTVSKTVHVLTNAQPNTVDLEITAEIYVPENKK